MKCPRCGRSLEAHRIAVRRGRAPLVECAEPASILFERGGCWCDDECSCPPSTRYAKTVTYAVAPVGWYEIADVVRLLADLKSLVEIPA